MSRVFKVKSEKREANYSTAIWLKILKRAEFQALSSNQHREVVQTLRDMIVGMSADDNEYLIHISNREKNLVIDQLKKYPMNLELSSMQAALKKDLESKNYKLLIKRSVFYLIHLKKVYTSQSEIEAHLLELIDHILGPLKNQLLKVAAEYWDGVFERFLAEPAK